MSGQLKKERGLFAAIMLWCALSGAETLSKDDKLLKTDFFCVIIMFIGDTALKSRKRFRFSV
jgi:hypothetical protein